MMKNIYILLAFIALIGATSCEDYLDINEDPDSPTDALIEDLLPTAQASAVFGVSQNLNRIGSDVVQYLAGRYDAGDINPSSTGNTWRFTWYAGALQDLEIIINKATASEDFHYVGVAKLLKAYTYNHMVDVWDSIPYSQALQPEFEYPKFDSGIEIYNSLFQLIDEGIEDLSKSNNTSLSNIDLIYNGDVASWVRMGNTLKLKMYLQLKHFDADKAKTGIENLVKEGHLISEASQDFNFYYNKSSSPENRNPAFQADYVTKGEAYVNTFFYEFMSDNNDPRLPYYFYLQSDDFEGRYEGDPAPTGNDNGTRTVQGIYPCGGKFDNGDGQTVNGSSASGNGEFRMLTSFMSLYMQAEAVLSLNADLSIEVEVLFENAIRRSFEEVNSLEDVPKISDSDIDIYVNDRLAKFNDINSTTEQKLELLIQERWIAQYGNGIESYNDFRRTGYPKLRDPIETSNVFPFRFPYPEDELETNPNAPAQPENNVKVFWMKK